MRLFAVFTLCNFFTASVFTLDPKTHIADYLQRSWSTEEGLPSTMIWSILQTNDGYLWLGTASGLVRFDGVRFVLLPSRKRKWKAYSAMKSKFSIRFRS